MFKRMFKKFCLKQGDKVIIRQGNMIMEAGVEGFYCYGMSIYEGIIPFHAGLFYGCGYTDGRPPHYTLKKAWHFYPARICEWIRLKLPEKLGETIFGF